MYNLRKDKGLLYGENVFNILVTAPGYEHGDDDRTIEIMARAATLGGFSAYRFEIDNFKSDVYAWIKCNYVTDGIDVVLGTGETTVYDDKRGRVPLDTAIVIELHGDEFHQAAKAVYQFLVHGNTDLRHTHRQPYQRY
jgi:hypothetical protein